MSILIKGATLPDSCWDCEADFAYQIGCELWQDYEEFCERRHPNCPLVEIPTPHGRLIDADLFKELIKDSVPSWTIGVKIPTYGDMDIMDKIYFIPTILEAEEK